MDNYELLYLREVMRWLEHEGGKYEPLDFAALYDDWETRIRRGLPSELDRDYAYNLQEFKSPALPAPEVVSAEGAAWAMETQCTCRVIDGKHDPHCPGGGYG